MKENPTDNLDKLCDWCEKFRKKHKLTVQELLTQVASYLGLSGVIMDLTEEEFKKWLNMSCLEVYKLGMKTREKKGE